MGSLMFLSVPNTQIPNPLAHRLFPEGSQPDEDCCELPLGQFLCQQNNRQASVKGSCYFTSEGSIISLFPGQNLSMTSRCSQENFKLVLMA